MIANLLCRGPYRPGKKWNGSLGLQFAPCRSEWDDRYSAEVLDVVEVLLANFLALGGVEIELIEAFVEKLVGANDCLLELGESFGELELL